MSGTGLSLIQDPLSFIDKLGQSFALSQMFGCKTVPQGHVLALHCVMESVSPLTIMQNYHFIEGKLSMRADAMLGRFNANGGKHKIISRTSELVEVELTKDGETQRFSLSWADAQKEPFTKAKDGGVAFNYSTPLKRKQMLWARVVSDGVRAMDPGVICGAYTPEELDDDPTPAPAGVIDGEVVAAAPAAQPVATESPAKKTRKAKESPEAPSTVTPVETVSDSQTRPSETLTTGDASTTSTDSTAGESIASAVSEPETKPEPAASGLPQIVIDIIQLRDYVGPRWPKDSKNGPWESVWPKVKSACKVPECPTDEESLTKAPEASQTKILGYMNQQRVIVDKLGSSKDLNTWANQSPSATK